MQQYSNEEVIKLVNNLRAEETERTWLEFKGNNKGPEMIGQYVSSISNSAALAKRTCGYLLWGVDDVTHDLIDTDFDFNKYKKGNTDITIWLATVLKPMPFIDYRKIDIDGNTVGILKVDAAKVEPVKFQNEAYIRRGQNQKKLKDCPDIERELWNVFAQYEYEKQIAMENVSIDKALDLLDYESYFRLLNLDVPGSKENIISALINDKMLKKNDFGNVDIMNLGAILFARRLDAFDGMERKAIRVVQYNGTNKMSPTKKEQIGAKGYASGFEGLIHYINGILPTNEIMGEALRKDVPMYPTLSVREVVANAIIHQDLTMHGTGIMVEIFSDRMEISNPGSPLIDIDRFVDHPPISRNEMMAAFMRRIGVCEERGSGFDKIIAQVELFQLPAPEIDVFESHTKVTLFAYKEYADISKEERIWACYMHTCLKQVNREYVTNASLRERFRVEKKNSSMISRLLNETVERGLIKLVDENAGDRGKKYMPYWA